MRIPVTAIIKSVRFFVILRIRDIALRNGTLDRNNAKDSRRVVRMFRETHAISAMTSSTTNYVKASSDGALRVKAPLTTRISSLKQLKKLMKSNFLQRVWPFGGFFEQNSIRKKQDVSCMIRIIHDTSCFFLILFCSKNPPKGHTLWRKFDFISFFNCFKLEILVVNGALTLKAPSLEAFT